MELAMNDKGSMTGPSRVCCYCVGNAPCAREFEVNACRQVTHAESEKGNAWNSAGIFLITSKRFFVRKMGTGTAPQLGGNGISFARLRPVPILRKYRFSIHFHGDPSSLSPEN
jgi:hypothetical protein